MTSSPPRSASRDLRRATRALAVPDRSTLATALCLAAALLVYGVLGFDYAVRTPIWQNPDEPAHYNYVAQVAQTATLPELRPGDWDADLLERLKTGQLEPGDSISTIRYEAWQPPLFYLVAAPVFRLGSMDDPAREVLRLRLLGVVFGGATLLVAYGLARRALGPALALAVPWVLAGVPMFTSVDASVSIDPLANLLAAAGLWVLLVWLLDGGGWRRALLVGVILGLGLLTKLAVGTLVPLAMGVALLRGRRRLREAVIVAASAGLLLVPWLVHQVTTYGWTDPLATQRHAAVVVGQARFPGWSADYLANFLTASFHSFWAQFGWMALPAPDRLYWAWGVLTLWAVAGLAARRAWLRSPGGLLMVCSLVAAIIAYIGYNLEFEQFQGRYLFPALAPIGVLLVAGWTAWLPSRPGVQRVAALAIGLLAVALNVLALQHVLVPGFQQIG